MFGVNIRPGSCNSTISDDGCSVITNFEKTSSLDMYNMISQHEGDSGYDATSPSSTNNLSLLEEQSESTSRTIGRYEFESCLCSDDENDPWTVLMEFSENDSLMPAEDDDDDDDDLLNNPHDFQCRISSDCSLHLHRFEQNCGNHPEDDLSASGESNSCRSSSRPVDIPTITRQPHICQRPPSSPESTRSRIDIITCSSQSTSIRIPFACRPLSSSLTRFPSGSPHHPLSWPVFRPLLDWWRRPSVSETADSPRPRFHPDEGGVLEDHEIDELLNYDISDEVFDDDDDESGQFSFGKMVKDEESSTKDRRLQQMPLQVDVRISPPSCSFDLNRNILENPESGRDHLQQSCANVGQMLRRLSDEFRPRGGEIKDESNNRRYPPHYHLERFSRRDIRQLFSAG